MSAYPLCEKLLGSSLGWNKDVLIPARDVENALSASPVVYGDKVPGEKEMLMWYEGPSSYGKSTHQARLICVGPIEKKECEHKRIAHWNFTDLTETTCLDCHKKLRPKWEVCE